MKGKNNITIKSGNIFKSHMQTIVNPVNCKGVMGAGLAKIYKHKFPDMFVAYRHECKTSNLKIGQLHLWKNPIRKWPWILNFPTKNHWKNKSRIEWIEKGLVKLETIYKDWGIESIAFPALGSSLGGLKWDDVKNLMILYLGKFDIPVEIYEPLKTKKKY